MKKLLKIALLPCLAALTFTAAPVAQAVTVSSSAPTVTTLTSGTSSTATLTKQQIKQQKKLRKKCAKLSSGKINAKKRAKLAAMCKTTAATTEEATKPTPPASSNAGGNSSNSNAGGNGNNAVVELIQSSPSLFVPLVAGTEKTDDDSSETTAELITETPQSVPEPGSLALLGLGLIGLGFARRRATR